MFLQMGCFCVETIGLFFFAGRNSGFLCLRSMGCFCVETIGLFFCWEKLRFSLFEVLGLSANGLFLCGNNWAVLFPGLNPAKGRKEKGPSKARRTTSELRQFCVAEEKNMWKKLGLSLFEVLGVSANGLFLCGNNWAVFVWKKLRFSLFEVLGVSANGLFLCGNNWAVFVWKNSGFLWLRS